MNFHELVQNRYSVREYKSDPVPREALEKVLEAARLAPTAANRQPVRLVVLETAKGKEQFRALYHRDWVLQAPILIFICAVPGEAWVRQDGRNYALVDAAIVMDHLILAAADQGLGTCWVANFNAEEARRMLHIPDAVDPVAFTPLGFPADKPKSKERKPLQSIVYWGCWGSGE